MLIPFTKMHGLGNDFVLLDERQSSFHLDPAQLSLLADRRFGVGCDQILVIEQSTIPHAVARYRVFNADGSGAEHCGNGVRCVARYLRDSGELDGDELALEINGAAFDLVIQSDKCVRVDMGCPQFAPAAIPIAAPDRQTRYAVSVDGKRVEFGCVSMGNPHAVVMVDAVDDVEIAALGARCQEHEFFPEKVNVGFMQLIDRARAKLRVYERGVGETLACGTGACAAMVIGRLWGKLDALVEVELRGGTLRIEWSGSDTDRVWMTGPADRVFEGIIEL